MLQTKDKRKRNIMINTLMIREAIGKNLPSKDREVINAVYRIIQTRPNDDKRWFDEIEKTIERHFENEDRTVRKTDD